MRERCWRLQRRHVAASTVHWFLAFLSSLLQEGGVLVLPVVIVGVTQAGAAAAATTCALTCQNGGECREGFVPPPPESDGGDQVDNNIKGGGFYCHCPRGYFGPSCEIKYVVCATQNDTCFNGESCYRDVDQAGSPYYHCECDVHSSDMSKPYAIQFCQHAATSFCVKGVKDLKSLGPAGGSYCNSAGKCKPPRNDTHHAGCFCPNDWTGSHCEIPVGYEDVVAEMSAPAAKQSSATGASLFETQTWYIIKAVLSFFALFLMLSAVMVLVYHGMSGNNQQNQQERQQPQRGRSPTQRPRRRRNQRVGRGGRQQIPQDEDDEDDEPETELTTQGPYRDANKDDDEDDDEDESDREVI